MSEQPPFDGATVDVLALPQSQEARQRFVAACEESLRSGGEPPDLDSFLGGIGEAELFTLRRELARIAQGYEQRRSQTKLSPNGNDTAAESVGATVELPDPAEEAPTVTHELPAAPQRGTENAAADATTDFVSAAFEVAEELKATRTQEGAAGPDPKPRPKLKIPQVPGYDILGVLGRGGMGVVYKARQRGLKRVVALKMILAGDHASEHDLARFRSEAVAVAQFQHPNIVQIYEIGEHDGKPFFSLEYVDGGSLARKVAGTPLPAKAAAETARAMAQAMQYAHDKGIIHRDLKPANVLLTTDGQPKITDFGLAKRLDEDSGRTRHGSVLGTPSYMSPEQADGRLEDVGPLSDVYSLGAILYELLTGRAPFRAPTVLDTLAQVRKQEPVSPVQLQPGTPRDLETICLKCLQKEPKKRYESAGELAEDLRRYQAGEPILARPVPLWEHAWRWCRRNPVVASLSGLLLALIVVSLVGLTAGIFAINNEKNAKEQETIRANQAADDAKKDELIAKKARDQAVRKQYTAVSQVLNLAKQTQKAMRPKGNNSEVDAQMRPIRDELLKAVRSHMLELAKEMADSGLSDSAVIFAHQSLGDLFRDLGLSDEALSQYEQGRKLAKQLSENKKDDDRHRANLGMMLKRIGAMQIDLKADLPAARAYFQEGLGLQEDVEAHPFNNYYTATDHRRLKSFYLLGLGQVALSAGDPAAARKEFERVVKYRSEWLEAEPDNRIAKSYLAQAYLVLADTCWRLDDDKAMHAAFAQAVKHAEGLAGLKLDTPTDSYKADLAEVLMTYGDAYFRLGKTDEAKRYYDKSIPPLTEAYTKDPESLDYIKLVVRAKYGQGLVARKAKDAKAAEYFDSALKRCEKLTAIDTENLPYRAELLACLARNGKTAEALKKADALRPLVAKDPELLVQVAGCYALCAEAAADDAGKKALTDKALAILRDVTKNGYKDVVNLKTHPDLAPLADDATFKELVEKLR